MMGNGEKSKINDLYERLLQFGKDVRLFVRKISKDTQNIEDGKQLIRSSGSVGANYIEAWDAVSPKDELHRLKISRKECKESRHWLILLYVPEDMTELELFRQKLAQEALELTKILGSIVYKKGI